MSLPVSVSAAGNYTFDRIDSWLGDVGLGTMAINNDGVVAYTNLARFDLTGLLRDVYLGKANTAPVNLTNGREDLYKTIVGSLNNHGTVALVALRADGSEGIYTASQSGGLTLVASGPPADINTFYANPSLNDSGDVVFMRGVSIVEVSAGQSHTIFDDPLLYPAFALGNLNSHGAAPLLFANRLYAVSDAGKEIYAEQGDLWSSAFAPSINDNGVIAFTGGSSCGDVKIATPGNVKTIYTATSPDCLWAHMSINNHGEVLISTFKSLFVDDPSTGRVIGVGDTLFGSTVAYVDANPIGPGNVINDHGQIAFHYILTNGEKGIAVATPADGNSAPSAPTISTGGILSASGFGGFSSLTPGSWVEIYGKGFSDTTRVWTGADFIDGLAPTSLEGAKVTIGGVPAFIDYVSPTQINALLPSNLPLGEVQLQVTTASGMTVSSQVNVVPVEPGLLAPASLAAQGTQYAAALFPDGATFALPRNLIAGVNSRAAKPGDTLVTYGIGFGQVSDGLTAGQLITQANAILAPVEIEVGGTPATVSYAGLSPGSTGLYQFNFIVPEVPDGDAVSLTFRLNGVPGTQKLTIAVHH